MASAGGRFFEFSQNAVCPGEKLMFRVVAPERARGMEYSRGKSGIRGRSLFRDLAECSLPGGKVDVSRRGAGARPRNGVFPGGKWHSRDVVFSSFRRMQFPLGKK